MAIDFPSSPTVGQTYTFSGTTWQWNGSAWDNIGSSTTTATDFVPSLMLGGM